VDPSRLLGWACWSGPPSADRIVDAVGGGTLEPLPPDSRIRWAAAIHPETRTGPTRLIWIEDADPTASLGGPDGVAGADAVVGIETLLPAANSGDPWAAWLDLARSLQAIGVDGPLLDPITGRWFDPPTIRRLLEARSPGASDGLPLPDEHLWSVRAARLDGGRGVWLATEGLARVGLPELEMLEVPEGLADAAAALIDALAGLACEQPPPRDRPWTVGPRLAVAARTPEEVLETIDERSAGSRRHRGGRVPVASGDRIDSIVVCGTEPRGRYRRIWTAPIEVLQAVAGGSAVHRSDRAALRQHHLAQRHLDLVDASLEARVGATVSIAGGGEDGTQWGRILQAIGDRWSVQPVDLAGRPAIGEPESFVGRRDVVDWRIEIGGVPYGPEDASRLSDTLASTVEGAAGTSRGDGA